MKQPLIALVPLYDEKKDSYWMLPQYMKAIEKAGGIPVMLPLTIDEDIITRLVDMYDGFLLTGGQDVNPEIYGESKKETVGPICLERDLMEGILFKRIMEKDKPIFGICRGLQVMNVFLGGTLYQDIPTERENALQHQQLPPYTKPVHAVHIEKNSDLYNIIGKETLQVNSYHHQAIKDVADRLTPVAYAEDGIIEAVEIPGKKCVFAVQWHPEYTHEEDEESMKLFKHFVQASQNNRE